MKKWIQNTPWPLPAVMLWVIVYFTVYALGKPIGILAVWGIAGLGIGIALKINEQKHKQIISALGVVGILSMDASSNAWLWGVGLVLLWIGFPKKYWHEAPWYPSQKKDISHIRQALEKANLTQAIQGIAEFGVGTGSAVALLQRQWPEALIKGAEINLWAFLYSRVRFIKQKNIHLYYKSYWDMPLDGVQLIYVFSRPEQMQRIYEHVKKNSSAEVLLVSMGFYVPYVKVDLLINQRLGVHQLNCLPKDFKEIWCNKHTVYIYKIKAEQKE